MTNLIALSKEMHKNLRVTTNYNQRPEMNTRMVPVLISELLRIGANLPIFLTKHAETGEFVCIALLGFAEDENLYLHQGEWLANSLPLAFERQPFHISQEDDAVYIDMDNPRVNESNGEALFLDNNELSPYMSQMMGNLEAIQNGVQETKNFVDALLTYDLIEPIKLDITFDDQSAEKIDGLYTISAQKLAQLTSDKLAKSYQSGCLQGAYIMLHSVEHVKSLIAKKNKRFNLDK